ncbi:unnamed protein product, partial [Didymodactylos carnosus]
VFPQQWKRGLVNPLFKSGDSLEPNNYRPITLLPALSKVCERVVFRQLYNYLTKYKLLSPFQSGFIAKDSTTNMLLNVVHEINAGLENHHYVRAVLLDFQKAFDNVNHRGLLLKLEKKGIQGKALKWFESYLTGRMIQTILEGVISSPLKIDKGVPQGSVLGPLLFLLYIDDLSLNIQSTIKLYADDVFLVSHHNDPLVATAILNKDLERVRSWSVRWYIPLNLKKCESITFSSRRHRTRALALPPLVLNSVPLKEYEEVKYLACG